MVRFAWLARPALLLVALGLLGGCARVKPWQREVHARRSMQTDGDKAARKIDGHVEEYREGSIGGAGVGGGGCGCN